MKKVKSNRGRPASIDEDELKRLIASGKMPVEIAAIFKTSPQNIFGIMKRRGYKTVKKIIQFTN